MTPRRRRPANPRGLLAMGLVLTTGAAALLVAYNAVGRVQPERGGRATEALVVDGPLSLLPAFADTPNSRDVSSLLYRGLTRTGAAGKPVGELARSWEVDPAARTFTFHLRSNLRWSDGAPLTSADALYTLTVLQSDADARSAAGQAWGGITAIAPDPLTVTYTLPQSSPAFLALTSTGLLPQHALQPRPLTSLRGTTDAPTSGPFTVTEAAPTHLLLSRNRHAFEPPYLDELDLRLYSSRAAALQALAAGEVDIFAGLTPDDARRVAGTLNRRVQSGATFAYAQLLMNQKVEALGDERVRQAVGLAIDRDALLRGPLAGYASLAEGPIPPAVTWATLPGAHQRYDPAGANRALDAAGWERHGSGRSKDGKPLRLRILAPEGSPYRGVAEAISRDLARVGVATSAAALPAEALVSQLQGHQFDLALTAVDNGPDPDPYVFWHSSQAGPGGFNFSGMPARPALDKALEDGRSTTDFAGRKAAYLDAQREILASHAAVFLYTPQAIVGLRDRLQGFALPPGSERYDSAQKWFVVSHRRLWGPV